MKWREDPPDATMSFVGVEGCRERLVSSQRYAKIRILCSVIEEDFEFLSGGCFRRDEDGVIVAAARTGALEGGCHGAFVVVRNVDLTDK